MKVSLVNTMIIVMKLMTRIVKILTVKIIIIIKIRIFKICKSIQTKTNNKII